MSNDRKSEYDRGTKTLWVYWTDLKGQRLINRDELQPYIEMLKNGENGPDPIKAVNFVFEDEGTARYNHDSLKFARVATWLLHSGVRRPLNPEDAPDFDVREDFGIR
ncbi:MAG: hypothetical protein AAFX99_22930 [Myxococcota bacterium]